ncbi:OSBL8 protein, partial [Polyodon spathula]|nr:OSBL8 protein [Polyodon spathula]
MPLTMPGSLYQHGEIKDHLATSTALMTSDEAHPVTPGKMSQRQGKEGHPIQTKELLQPSALSPGVSYSIVHPNIQAWKWTEPTLATENNISLENTAESLNPLLHMKS